MHWYFLSRTRLNEITWLQVPENDAGEEEVPRLCLAPTVWQSLLAIGGFGVEYFIHVVDVTNPLPSRFAVDAVVTGEHVVTQEILDAAGGSLPARCIGRVCCDGVLMNLLDVHRKAGLLPADPADELATVWDIEGDLWTYRFATSCKCS
jgi:hypothetical protein